MSLGQDLKSAIQETGLSFHLYRGGVLMSESEYVWIKRNSQVTKPFIREFFLEGQLPYDSSARSGDLVYLPYLGRRYLIAHATPDAFEDEVYRLSVVLYLANALVSVVRPVQVRSPSTYLARPRWEIVAKDVYTTLTSPLYGHELNSDSPVGPVVTEVHELYIPSSYDVKSMDIVRLASDFYRVETVKKRRYEGLDVLELHEDNSSETTTTTTTAP